MLFVGTSGRVGLTPAYAGNMLMTLEINSFFQAHPRFRGEYRLMATAERLDAGSPPLMRGIWTGHVRQFYLETTYYYSAYH